MRPGGVLGFVVLVMAFLGLIMLVFPSGGIKLTESLTLHFPTFAELFLPDTVEYADVAGIIDSDIDLDSLEAEIGGSLDSLAIDSIMAANAEELVKSIHRLEFGKKGKDDLYRLFSKLPQAGKRLIRVMHYGDSQIEGDRITSFFRNKLQGRYGGKGPGFIPPVSAYDYRFSYEQENSGSWKRYPGYGRPDKSVPHTGYGALASFSRFAPFWVDSLPNDSVVYQAQVKISKSKLSYNLVRSYSSCKLYYGKNRKAVSVIIKVDGTEVSRDSLPPSAGLAVRTWSVSPQQSVTLSFSGYDSPDIYGIALEGNTGIVVDNIALRGSSGTIFTKMERASLEAMYSRSHVELFILQFGGNVMPSIEDEQQCLDYGRYFYSQIMRLRSLCPDASIIVIGPSDMSLKEKDSYITYPLLPNVRNALKDATFRAGGAYWDMYEAMGGKNSMPGWVSANPPLAATDYTHFSTGGAKVIANMFYNAFLLEYNEYLASTRKEAEKTKKDTVIKGK